MKITGILIRIENKKLYRKFEVEFEECEQYWEDKLNEYGVSLETLEEEVRANQQKELEDYENAFENQEPDLKRYYYIPNNSKTKF